MSIASLPLVVPPPRAPAPVARPCAAPPGSKLGAGDAGSAPAAPDWRDIPVFIINRNRLEAMDRLVRWLRRAGTRRIVIVDNASDYPPLLTYYERLPEGVRVLLLQQNLGPYALWQHGVHLVLDTPYVVTDSDVVPDESCPADLIGVLHAQLVRWPDAKKVGMALRIDDLPQAYGEVDTVRKWESQFWEHPVAPGVYAAPVDTTFALYPPRGEFSNEPCNLRLGHPYVARHTPWYVDEGALSDEERHYREHTSVQFSNWSVARKQSWVARSQRVAAFDQRPRVLHLDGGRQYIPGWVNGGLGEGRFDVGFDVAHCRTQPPALAEGTFDGILLSHVLQSVQDADALFEVLYRLAKPNARAFVRVAHGAGAAAWTDPTHVRAWFEGSFHFLSQPARAPGVGDYLGDWEVEGVWCVQPEGAAQPLEVIATLRAVKPARPRGGVRPVRTVPAQRLLDARVDPQFVTAAPAHD